MDYQIVASFLVENETQEAIMEALGMVKSWNPEFAPKFEMTD